MMKSNIKFCLSFLVSGLLAASIVVITFHVPASQMTSNKVHMASIKK